MGQQEVFELLKNKRLSGDDSFYSIADIRKMVMSNPSDTNSVETVSRSIHRLYFWGLLDRKNFEFRFKKTKFDNSMI